MTSGPIPISAATRAALLELAARTGRPAGEMLTLAVDEYRRRLNTVAPVSEIPGVNPKDVWDAVAQADAGQLTPHDDVFAGLRRRS